MIFNIITKDRYTITVDKDVNGYSIRDDFSGTILYENMDYAVAVRHVAKLNLDHHILMEWSLNQATLIRV